MYLSRFPKYLISAIVLLKHRLVNDHMLLAMLLVAGGLWVLKPVTVAEMVVRVHWHTMAVLLGLMLLSRTLELSGYLSLWGQHLLAQLRGERRLVAGLVIFSSLLSAVVTNDVALFIVIPLTLSLARMASLPVGRIVVFEALAVNAGSTLSPVGNPQNLYLWQRSSIGFGEFLMAMLPLAALLIALLLLLIPLAFPKKTIAFHVGTPSATHSAKMLYAALIGYPLFLVLVELGFVGVAVMVAVLIALLVARHAIVSIDWWLLGVFLLMFINLSLLGEFSIVQHGIATLKALPGGDVTLGILTSQVLSNVPATLLLAEHAQWQPLAWGVNVGGFGLAIGSMANLIALRLAHQPGIWKEFHCWSIPMLALGWLSAGLLAFYR